MILNDQSVPVERTSLPEPLRIGPGSTFIPSEGWDTVLVSGVSGRLWRLDFCSGAPPGTCATGIVLPATEFEAVDLAADRVLVMDYDNHAHVFDLSDGRILLRLASEGYACLTPDGLYLIEFESEITRIWRLDGDPASPVSTRLFHVPSIAYNGLHSVARVTMPRGNRAFHVVVGHYGFAVDYAVGYDNSGQLILSAEPRIHNDHFVYDPVVVSPGNRYPFVALNHGYSARLKVIDIVEGKSRDCPDRAPFNYGRFRGAILSRDRREMLVRTADGWWLWSFAADNMTLFCSPEIEPLHFESGCVWAVRADDPATLLRYAVSGS